MRQGGFALSDRILVASGGGGQGALAALGDGRRGGAGGGSRGRAGCIGNAFSYDCTLGEPGARGMDDARWGGALPRERVPAIAVVGRNAVRVRRRPTREQLFPL